MAAAVSGCEPAAMRPTIAHLTIALALGRIQDLVGDVSRVLDEFVGFHAAAATRLEVVELADLVVGPAGVAQGVGDLEVAGELVGVEVVAAFGERPRPVAGGHAGGVG
jgi:hypothetical protein